MTPQPTALIEAAELKRMYLSAQRATRNNEGVLREIAADLLDVLAENKALRAMLNEQTNPVTLT